MRVLVIGPVSPPYGGVANFIENIVKQEAMKDVKISIHRVGRRESDINLFKFLFCEVLDISRFIVENKFKNIDIVHIHTSSDWSFFRNCIYFFIIRLMSKDKILIHIHSGKFESFYNDSFSIIKKLIIYVLSSCDAIVVTSSRWKRTLKDIIGNDAKIFVVYNGFDDRTFVYMCVEDARYHLNIPKDKKIILNVGSLYEYKGHLSLIETADIIRKERNDILVYIIGDGPMKNELERTIKDKELENNVFLLGRKTSLEIRNFINSCDVFVLPSTIEGNPTVMFETLGCGKPFIGTRVGGVPEIISSCDYGFTVEPSDSKDMAKKIMLALDKKWDHDIICKYAKRFTWGGISKDVLQVYRDI